MKNNNKQLTTKQENFLEHLLVTGGDPKRAAELAGYTTHWHVVKALKNEIIEMASTILAQTILDRVGLGKRETMDVKHEVSGGVFILPAKQEVIIEA